MLMSGSRHDEFVETVGVSSRVVHDMRVGGFARLRVGRRLHICVVLCGDRMAENLLPHLVCWEFHHVVSNGSSGRFDRAAEESWIGGSFGLPSDREQRIRREARQRLDVLFRKHQDFEVFGKEENMAEVLGVDVCSRGGENLKWIEVVALASLTSLYQQTGHRCSSMFASVIKDVNLGQLLTLNLFLDMVPTTPAPLLARGSLGALVG